MKYRVLVIAIVLLAQAPDGYAQGGAAPIDAMILPPSPGVVKKVAPKILPAQAPVQTQSGVQEQVESVAPVTVPSIGKTDIVVGKPIPKIKRVRPVTPPGPQL
jgi:hypothetical protein